MKYRVEIDKRAAKQVASLHRATAERVLDALDALGDEPRPSGCLKIKGRADYAWRIRVGDYRVLYRIHDDRLVVRVYGVLRRDEAYRD